MNILFLVPQYLDLYKPIESELKRRGYQITTIFDEHINGDPFYKEENLIKRTNKYIKNLINNVHEKYWRTLINKNKNLNTTLYDIFICINGYSLSSTLIKYLKTKNPKIKTILYLWDTVNYYNFKRHFSHFDKILSFDWEDCKKYNIKYLPFYWIPYNKDNNTKYKLSMIGSNHDDRFIIASKISSILDKYNIPYNIKLYTPIRNITIKDRIKYLWYQIKNDNNKINEYKIQTGKLKSKLLIDKFISPNEVQNIMQNSEYILDTDRSSQSGTTPRVIWALAQNKRIITTNSHIKKLPFYDEKFIYIIDRTNPKIDFIIKDINNNEIYSGKNYIEKLRIDLWILNFI